MTSVAVAEWDTDSSSAKTTISMGSRVIVTCPCRNPADAQRQLVKAGMELVAAALATCFGITLSRELGRLGLSAHRASTRSSLRVHLKNNELIISRAALKVVATVPDAKPGDFINATVTAKKTCPVCRFLNVEIEMDAKLKR
jgi:organic hydroperoxide reductase OsmC/OhrA